MVAENRKALFQPDGLIQLGAKQSLAINASIAGAEHCSGEWVFQSQWVRTMSGKINTRLQSNEVIIMLSSLQLPESRARLLA